MLKVGEDVEIRARLVKRDVVIADNSGNVVVTLWQERRNEVKMNYSYKLACHALNGPPTKLCPPDCLK